MGKGSASLVPGGRTACGGTAFTPRRTFKEKEVCFLDFPIYSKAVQNTLYLHVK